MASQNMGPPMSAPTGFLSPYVARQQDGMRPGTQAYALPQQHQSGLAKISKFALGKLGGAFQTASTTAAFNAEDQVLAAAIRVDAVTTTTQMQNQGYEYGYGGGYCTCTGPSDSMNYVYQC